jgi:hypothetical protein
MNVDGSGRTRLTDNPKRYEHGPPTWSPEGKRIAFTSEDKKGSEIWIRDIRDELRRLGPHAADRQPSGGLLPRLATVSCLIHRSAWRDCLESSWMGRIARLSVARSAEKGTLSPVVQAHGTMKWSLSGVSRQSLEEEFCELHPSRILGSPRSPGPMRRAYLACTRGVRSR